MPSGSKRFLVFAVAALACWLTAREARADGINMGFVATAGIIVLEPIRLPWRSARRRSRIEDARIRDSWRLSFPSG